MKTHGGAAIAILGIFAAILCVAHAEVVTWEPCTYTEGRTANNCTINELRVTPCKEAAQGKPCQIKRGLNATIEFDYTPNFDGEKLESRAYWTNQIIDLPFMGMDSNACLATVCPAVSGQKQTYHMELPISKKYPIRTYDVKWTLDNTHEQECCFIFKIKFYK